jgi:hypothetical protein
MRTVSAGTEERQTATTFTETPHIARRLKAILFVLVTLLLWFVFALLSQAIVATVPRVGDCMRAQGVVGCVKTLAISTSAVSPASEPQAIDAQAENRNFSVDARCWPRWMQAIHPPALAWWARRWYTIRRPTAPKGEPFAYPTR